MHAKSFFFARVVVLRACHQCLHLLTMISTIILWSAATRAFECTDCEPVVDGRAKVLMQKQYVTGDSQEITQPSASPAQTGLSCEF